MHCLSMADAHVAWCATMLVVILHVDMVKVAVYASRGLDTCTWWTISSLAELRPAPELPYFRYDGLLR